MMVVIPRLSREKYLRALTSLRLSVWGKEAHTLTPLLVMVDSSPLLPCATDGLKLESLMLLLVAVSRKRAVVITISCS